MKKQMLKSISNLSFLHFLLFTFHFSLFTFFAFAQTPTPTPTPKSDDDDVIKIESRLIVVPVSVTDAKGQSVLGLRKEDFSVSEENQNQEIAEVGNAENVPLEIAVLLDVSGSTDPMFPFEQDTAARFLQTVMRPDDRATIFAIGENPQVVKSRDTAENAAVAIKQIQPTKGFTAFYDSITLAANYLNKNAPVKSRKVIIAISDGEDTNSVGIRKAFAEAYKKLGAKLDTMTQKQRVEVLVQTRNEARGKEQSKVIQSLQNADTVFYSINPAGSSFQLNKMSQFGQDTMLAFADQTGGTAYLPKFQPVNLKDNLQNDFNGRKNIETLDNIFRQLTNELRSQYLIQYYSEGDFPINKYVKIRVDLKNQTNLRIRSRQGYFVKPN
jgi:Ca-activated chloride channel family protein